MVRLPKGLLLIIALSAFAVFTTGCGNTGNSEIRFVHAISNGPPGGVDIEFDNDKIFTAMNFGQVLPAAPAYQSVPPGTDTITVLDTGTTNQAFSPVTANISASTQYTLLMAGFLSGSGPTAPTVYVITDNNNPPTSGNIEIRIIDGSSYTPQGGFNVYIVPPGTQITTQTKPTISGVLLGQSSYQTLAYASTGYDVVVTPNGSILEYFSHPLTSLSTGSITTMVIMDLPPQDGGGVSANPLVWTDLK
ncbi:MAG: DUF4397 domain-containing protein [Terriglobales bacterium]